MDYSQVSTNYAATNTPPNPIVLFIMLIFVILMIASWWKIFVKAGKPGWAVIIPFYNVYVLLKIVGKPGWWLILCFIPLVNIIIGLIVAIDLAKVFGKDALFGVVLNWLFSPIGALILGFGSAKYRK